MSSMRIGIFIGVVLSGLLMPFWFFIACAFLYALWKPGYELIVLGMFIDAQFGIPENEFPYVYTLSLGILVLATSFLKPYLRFYEA